jgi:ferritin-like metal-binding protein YciE
MPEDTRHRLLRYLNDAHAMEVGGLTALQDSADRTADPEARSLFNELSGIARTQIDRLAARIESLGGNVAVNKSLFNSMLAKGHRLTNAFHDQADKDTQEVIKAAGMSWLEVGAYTSLSAYSRAIGDEQTATLGDTLAEEERLAADRLNRLIPRLAVIPATQPDLYADRDRERSYSSGGGPTAMVSSGAMIPALALGGAALVTWAIMRSRGSGSSGGSGDYYSGSGGWERSSATRYGATRSGYDRGMDYDRQQQQPASWSGDAATTGTTATSGQNSFTSASTSGTAGSASSTGSDLGTGSASGIGSTSGTGSTTRKRSSGRTGSASSSSTDMTAGAGTDEQTGQTG